MRKHLNLKKIQPLTNYQKLAIGTWRDAKDPSIYGSLDLDYEKAQSLRDELLQSQQINLTPTYMFSQAAALILAVRPQLNVILTGDKLYQRDIVSISFMVSMDAKGDNSENFDLSSCVIHDVTKLNLIELYNKLKTEVNLTKQNKSATRKAQKNILGKIPSQLMKYFLNLSSFVMYSLNLKLKNVPHDPFGTLMISNLGQMGFDKAYIPLVPYAKVPILIAIGMVKPRPVATKDRTVEVRDILRINFTVDHRYIDGKSLAIMEQMLQFSFKNPKKWLLPAAEDIKEEFRKEFYQSLLKK